MKQYDYITLSKAFGIILVVVGHFTSSVYMPEYYIRMKNFIFSFHMPLFMVLSGFLFQMSLYKKPDKISVIPFLKKKFLRLMVPYFFISFAIAALNLVIGRSMPVKRMVDWSYLLEIFYTNVGGSAVFLWFMYTLFMIFVISAICMCFKKGVVILGALSIALYFIPMPQLFYLSFVHSFIVYFWGGIVLFLLMERVKVRMSAVHIAGSALILTLAFYFRAWFPADYIQQLLNLICGFAGSYLIVSVSYWLAEREDSKILMSLGKYSAYIYLLHMAGVYFIRVVYEKVGLLFPLTYGIALIAAVIAGVLIPVLLTKYVIHKSQSLTFLMGGK
jgi:fucose 4-O-acetylase-like acetyltransferase